ncbi:MAG TPA: tetratricopeptide repeat protein [Pyrinomonadaceae bacterium]|nr:tetratricopeptide repeat protein [Pyrinomonadaceae bacterium]HMP67000.1 tetratricopeptide repeat protein [Pyrinomonadaceae bacterium]
MSQSWKTFLEGRIAQEEGNNERALEAYNAALSEDPNNVHFLRAKAAAQAALNDGDGAR